MNETPLAVPALHGGSDSEIIDELPFAYLRSDAMGVVTRANRVAHTLFPQFQGDLIGKHLWELVAADEERISQEAYRAIMSSGQEPPVIYRTLYSCSGEFRTYEIHRSLIRDEQGRPAGIHNVMIDVTQAQIEREKAHHRRVLLESVLGSVAEAVIIADALGFVRNVNPAAEALLGWKAAELIGKVIEKGMPVLSYVSKDCKALSFTRELEGHSKGIATIIDRERRELRVEISTSPIVDKESGCTSGVVTVLRRVD